MWFGFGLLLIAEAGRPISKIGCHSGAQPLHSVWLLSPHSTFLWALLRGLGSSPLGGVRTVTPFSQQLVSMNTWSRRQEARAASLFRTGPGHGHGVTSALFH